MNEIAKKLLKSSKEKRSTTKVRKWVVSHEGAYYAILFYWSRNRGDCVDVFGCDKKGGVEGQKEIIYRKAVKEADAGYNLAIEALSNYLSN